MTQAVISHVKQPANLCAVHIADSGRFTSSWFSWNFVHQNFSCAIYFVDFKLMCSFCVKYYVEVCLRLWKFSYFRPQNHPADSFTFIREASVVFILNYFHRNSLSSFLYLYLKCCKMIPCAFIKLQRVMFVDLRLGPK